MTDDKEMKLSHSLLRRQQRFFREEVFFRGDEEEKINELNKRE